MQERREDTIHTINRKMAKPTDPRSGSLQKGINPGMQMQRIGWPGSVMWQQAHPQASASIDQ
jgi:hypothetical protein